MYKEFDYLALSKALVDKSTALKVKSESSSYEVGYAQGYAEAAIDVMEFISNFQSDTLAAIKAESEDYVSLSEVEDECKEDN